MPKKPFFRDTAKKPTGKPQDYKPRKDRVEDIELDAPKKAPGKTPRYGTPGAKVAKAYEATGRSGASLDKPGRKKAAPANPKPVTSNARRPVPPRQPKELRTHTHWGDVAEWYDTLVGDEGSEYHRKVILPGVLRMLELNKMDDRPQIIDLACGQGVLCRRLAEEGCVVTGIDAALPLIEAARRRNQDDKLAITYEVADVTELLNEQGELLFNLRPESFDAVTIVLSIQNITPLSPVWEACHALLRPGGKLVMVMMHPCFRIPKQSDWLWDEASFTQQRVVRQYLGSTDIEIQTHPGHAAHGVDDSSTTHFHRPLQAYVNTMGNAGLFIDNMQEWASHKKDQAGPKKEAIDRARGEIPLFLAIRARKV